MRWSCVVLFAVAQLSSSRLVHADEPRLSGAPLSLSATLGGEQLCQASRRDSIDGKPEPAAPLPWGEQVYDEVVAVGSEAQLRCTGVLVGPRHVLTARHCLPATRVLFGHDVLRPLGSRAVIGFHTPRDQQPDVALLILDRPVHVAPPLRRGAEDLARPLGTLRPVGFGSTQRRWNLAYGRKRYIELPAVGWGCDARRARDTGCQPELELVLLPFAGQDTCEGDSGGPIYEPFAGQRRVVAITSRSTDGARVACGSGGIYVRLDRIASWLEPLLKSPIDPAAVSPADSKEEN